jgi:hypothetical protein
MNHHAEDQQGPVTKAKEDPRSIAAHIDDVVDLSRIYRESLARIDQYERLVNDGQELEGALKFGGFLIWSGIVSLCRRYAQPEHPKIDGDFLRWKAEELQRQVREKRNDRDQRAKLDEKQIAGINRRLDILAAQVARCHVYCPSTRPG